MLNDVTLAVAFVGGLVSFLSPCVVPLVPGFLAYLAGTSLKESGARRGEIFLNSVVFVLGFSVVFALLGVLLNTVLERVAYDAQVWLARIGGLLIIFFGLYLTKLIKIPFLEREHKIAVKITSLPRAATSFLFGTAFAVGWTPCVGAALGAILGIAATQPSAAFPLLLSYALGLGVPFLVVGLFAEKASKMIRRYATWFTYVNIVFGVLLIVLGVFVFTQQLNRLASFELLNNFLLR